MTNQNIEYRNAVYIDAEHTCVDCEINHPAFGWIPYTLNPADTDNTINNAELTAAMQAAGDVAAFVEPTPIVPTIEEVEATERKKRDALLKRGVDPLVSNPLLWASFDEAKQQDLLEYRQALLDVPDQDGFPYTHVWPVL